VCIHTYYKCHRVETGLCVRLCVIIFKTVCCVCYTLIKLCVVCVYIRVCCVCVYIHTTHTIERRPGFVCLLLKFSSANFAPYIDSPPVYMCIYTLIYIHIYMYICIHVCMYIYIYIFTIFVLFADSPPAYMCVQIYK